MASAYTLNIFVVNNDPTCGGLTIQSQVTTTECIQTFLVKISSQSNALGPFDVYTGSTLIPPAYSALTRTELVAGVPVTLYNDDPICINTITTIQCQPRTLFQNRYKLLNLYGTN